MTSAHRSLNSSRGSCLNLPLRFFGALRGTGPRATGGPQAPVGPDRLIRTCL